LATESELNDFLRSVERRAFKKALFHVRNDDAALDIVQDSMLKLAEHYGDKPAEELPLLFQRILGNTTLDWFRRQKTRNAVFVSLSSFESDDADNDFNLIEAIEHEDNAFTSIQPETRTIQKESVKEIETELMALPARQREAFLLRYWEDMDLAETAAVMGCTIGSVKTHCSRAVHSLAKALRSKGIHL
jgi:RNA polymerase sigma-70 factor (ECF subfamily)